MRRESNSTFSRPVLLLPLAALVAVLPVVVHGVSCGQDQVFHVESWIDAAHQLRHLQYPHWAFTAAWNAGEPRFVFYPPLSWLLGALLTMILPVAACPTAFVFLALMAAGLTFHRLAVRFTSPGAALLTSALYLANPYMLFCAFERSAYAELLAAAWIPLLLLAVLRGRPTVRSVAVPLALLWLTNAPAAVIGSYALVVLAVLRLATTAFAKRRTFGEPRFDEVMTDNVAHVAVRPSVASLTVTYLAGTILGLALPAYYLVPAAYERRYVQVSMAIIPNMRFQDNFLFDQTADAAHNVVNRTVSLLAVILVTLTVAALLALFLRRKREAPSTQDLLRCVAPTTMLVVFLLTPASAIVWRHLPEFAFLQFPWRLLILVTPVLALSVGLLCQRLMFRAHILIAATLVVPLVLTLVCFHGYAQACDPHDAPGNIAHLLRTGHGLGPTDEYTPSAADNDVLRSDDPGYWLLPAGANPNGPAPNTTPTPSELNPNLDTDDAPVPVAQTLSVAAPERLTLQLAEPALLVLHLRAYPNWEVTSMPAGEAEGAAKTPIERDDGLIVIPLPAGTDTVKIRWRYTPDEEFGLAISLLAMAAFALARPRDAARVAVRD